MKKILIVLLSTLLIAFAPLIHAETEIEPTIVVDYAVDPATLMPGDIGTVTITLFNGATDEVVHVTETRSGGNITEMEAFDMNAYIASASLAGDKEGVIAVTSDAYTSVGLIGPSDSTNFVYEIKADESASDGTHFLRFELIGGSNMEAFRYRIPVKIDETKLKLVASSIPSTVVRGVSTITLDVVNLRSSNISGVVVTPMGSDLAFNATEFYVGSVPPKDSVALAINIDTTSSTAGRKDLTFTARYTNGDTVHESDLAASITVVDRSILILTGITTEHTSPWYTITGDVNNLGATDLSGVVVAIGAADGVTPKQPYPEYFIGELESDDFGSFELSAELNDGIESVPLTIEYRDANRAYIVQHESIDVENSGAAAAARRSSGGMSTGMIVLIVLAGLLVIGVIAYSWKKRKDGAKGAEGADGTDEGDWK
ncbi:MAG: COG1361 S-layer family protein [Candidatus Methanogasteraceae archaeon]